MEDRLEIGSSTRNLGEVRNWVDAGARSAGCSSETVTKLKLVLSEAVTNIIRHSYGGNEERTILLSLASEEDRLRISVHDVGLPFDEKSYRPPDLGEAAESGYGVYIIHEYMDEVTYTSTPGEGNTLVMYKRIE